MEPAIDESALPQPTVHAFTASDGTELRLTNYAVRQEGPARARARLRQLRARVRARHRPQELHRVPRRARLRRLAVRLPREPRPRRRARRSSPSTTSRCATGRPRSTHIRSETGADSVQALGHCIGGLTLCMAIGGGLEGVRSATFSALAGHPIPTPAQPAARRRARADDACSKFGISARSAPTTARVAPGPRDRALSCARSRSSASTTAPSAAASTSSTATSSTTRGSTRRRWPTRCRVLRQRAT